MTLSTDSNYLGSINTETVTILTRLLHSAQQVAVTYIDGQLTEVRSEFQPRNADYGKRWTFWRKLQVGASKARKAHHTALNVRHKVSAEQSRFEYRFARP